MSPFASRKAELSRSESRHFGKLSHDLANTAIRQKVGFADAPGGEPFLSQVSSWFASSKLSANPTLHKAVALADAAIRQSEW